MPSKKKESSVCIRDLIIQYWKGDENGTKTIREISQCVKVPKSTVFDVIRKYKLTGQIRNLPGRGRKPKLSTRDVRKIQRKLVKNPFKPTTEIQAEIQNELGVMVTPQTNRNCIHKGGNSCRTARRKPKRKVWRKPGEALKPRNLLPSVKYGGGNVVFWGCMTASGPSQLEFIDGILNSDIYIDILNRNVKTSSRELGLVRYFTFQQDNDPKHTSKKSAAFFKKNKYKMLEWPAQSPDLNPIEHLWHHLEKVVRKTVVTNKTQLRTTIEEVWKNIDPAVTQNLVDSIPRRLQAVIAASGGITGY
ncbi:unnamed protein product [Allacma fusca]|uniref:Tc1-like transposase DDE domain-containing protein n=1 Tax=Allacma fusca TaxID=39272 RepID=A0A8J2NWM6_9HEXA|nr:unnamed protein product [Allacma fusca]